MLIEVGTKLKVDFVTFIGVSISLKMTAFTIGGGINKNNETRKRKLKEKREKEGIKKQREERKKIKGKRKKGE